jgi:hypothetical protein
MAEDWPEFFDDGGAHENKTHGIKTIPFLIQTAVARNTTDIVVCA